MDEIDLESLEEELANLDPEDLRYLSKLIAEDTPTIQRVINTLLDEPIPEANRSEEVEQQEEVELTDMEEYDLTGSGEPVYETPIMTPQLYRRIMADEFSQDQVEYIIKKSLKF